MIALARDAASAGGTGGELKGKLSNMAWLGGAVLSAGVALFSYRYLAKAGPVPSTVAHNRFLNLWIVVHAAAAATALLVGPVQFLPVVRRRWRWPKLHRWTGRTVNGGRISGQRGGVKAGQ